MNGEDPIHVHVHLGVAGTFPLRVADLLFADERLVVPEYEYVTPLGIARSRIPEVGRRARQRFREGGLAALVRGAERTHRIDYGTVERVRLYDGPGRPKLAVHVAAGPPYAYRIHAPVDADALQGALRSLGDRRDFAVESSSALGFSPTNSIRRFLADR